MDQESQFKREREKLVSILRAEGIKDERVLEAIGTIPRHLFMEETFWPHAYENIPLPIGSWQTISQPFVVASMTEALCQGKTLKTVLEVGTGSGYQAAVLSKVVGTVYSIERIFDLSEMAKKKLQQLGITNVEVRYGDGYLGLPEYAPFQGIIVTAAPPEVPKTLLEQLDEDARLIIPIGELGNQELIRIVRQGDEYKTTDLFGVRFVPLVKGVE